MLNLDPVPSAIRALPAAPGSAAAVPKQAAPVSAPAPAVQAPGFITQRFGSDAVRALKSSQSTLAALDSAIASMQNTLDNMRPADMAPAAKGAAQPSSPDQLSLALQSLSNARSAIVASAESVYQSFISSVPADGLIAGVDVASGSVAFNLEQTLLQMEGDVLLGRSTISTLVNYLLQ
jgi:hypothetical protein